MHCHSEICIAALKYVLPLRNRYFHSEICIATPKYVIQAECARSQTIIERFDVHYRPTNVQITVGNGFAVLIPSSCIACSYRLPPSIRTLPHIYGQSFEHAQNSCRAWINGRVPWDVFNNLGNTPSYILVGCALAHQKRGVLGAGTTRKRRVLGASTTRKRVNLELVL